MVRTSHRFSLRSLVGARRSRAHPCRGGRTVAATECSRSLGRSVHVRRSFCRAGCERSGRAVLVQGQLPGVKPRFFATPEKFRAWLAKNHGTAPELLVGFYKKACGKPSIEWPQSVDEALCVGWIDGIRRNIDAYSYSIRFTPRRAR